MKSLILTSIVLITIGCRTEYLESSKSHPQDILDPDGTDNPPRLTVKLPTIEPEDQELLDKSNNFGFKDSFNPEDLAQNGEASRIGSRGKNCISIEGSLKNTKCISLGAGEVGVITLGALKIVPPSIWTFGLHGTIDVSDDNDTGMEASGYFNYTAYKIKYLIPGSYHISFGMHDGMDFVIEEGKVTVVDLNSLEQRRAVIIHAPKEKAYSNGGCQGEHFLRWFKEGTSDDERYGNLFSKTLNDRRQGEPGDAVLVGIYGGAKLRHPEKIGFLYRNLFSSDRSDYWGEPIGPFYSDNAGEEPRHYQMGRLDISDVKVTNGDGSTNLVAGKYFIEREVGPGKWEELICSRYGIATKTGFDVTPGKYRVKTKYNTVESGEKESVKEITIGN